MKPSFQLRHRNVRREFVVEEGERQAELRAELLQSKWGSVGLGKHIISCFPDGGKIIHQRARPIEDYIANHDGMLAKAI